MSIFDLWGEPLDATLKFRLCQKCRSPNLAPNLLVSESLSREIGRTPTPTAAPRPPPTTPPTPTPTTPPTARSPSPPTAPQPGTPRTHATRAATATSPPPAVAALPPRRVTPLRRAGGRTSPTTPPTPTPTSTPTADFPTPAAYYAYYAYADYDAFDYDAFFAADYDRDAALTTSRLATPLPTLTSPSLVQIASGAPSSNAKGPHTAGHLRSRLRVGLQGLKLLLLRPRRIDDRADQSALGLPHGPAHRLLGHSPGA